MEVDYTKRHFLRVSSTKEAPVRPPYSVSEERFAEDCTRCKACVDICETKVISIDNAGLPFVDFSDDECTFCGLCSDVCPTKALDKSLNTAFNTTISIKKNCFAENNIYCQSCRDVCDESAITFDFFSQVIPTPQVNNDACTGCGACISICPQNSINIIKIKDA